jgi:hypothetical protein
LLAHNNKQGFGGSYQMWWKADNAPKHKSNKIIKVENIVNAHQSIKGDSPYCFLGGLVQ